jgi:mannitol-1-phosphate 5-dehydrogenase
VTKDKQIIIFGAGKIGRSFIGQLFGRAGYRVTFIDVDKKIIEAINREGRYRVVIRGERDETIWIEHVRAINGMDVESVAKAVADADLIAVSVGKLALGKVLPVIAEGLKLRRQLHGDRPLDIIIAENIREGAEFVRSILKEKLEPGYPLDDLVGLIETSIGKMVPILTEKDLQEDPLRVFAEPYNTLILDKKGFKNPIPDVPGLAPKDHIRAWVDRKLFIHNFGHAAAAYTGFLYNPDFVYLYEALEVRAIRDFVRHAMLQSGSVLLKMYPGEFTMEHIEEHADDLLSRFESRYLGDTIFRVGCDLNRKLLPDDRIVYPARTGLKLGMEVDLILKVLTFALFFRAVDDKGNPFPNDPDFYEKLKNGPESILTHLCGFHPVEHREVIEKVTVWYNELKKDSKSIRKMIGMK